MTLRIHRITFISRPLSLARGQYVAVIWCGLAIDQVGALFRRQFLEFLKEYFLALRSVAGGEREREAKVRVTE
jgi:hypothetical protein